MLLALELLDNVCNVNDFAEVPSLTLVAGNPGTLYVRIVDQSRQQSSDPSLFRRYIPASGASLTIQFTSIDSNNNISRTATNPFPGDTSIWSIPILPTDKITADSLTATLVEGSNSYKMDMIGTLVSQQVGAGKYFC